MIHRLIFIVTVIPMFFISLLWWVFSGKNLFIDYCDYFDAEFAKQKYERKHKIK